MASPRVAGGAVVVVLVVLLMMAMKMVRWWFVKRRRRRMDGCSAADFWVNYYFSYLYIRCDAP